MSSSKGTVMSLLTSKSLSSMVKGIRAHKAENAGNANAEAEYIAKCMAEIKTELQTTFPDVKAVAIQKLIYLQMIGYDISWAAFHIIELMSAAWFGHKRIGYLAASLSFTKSTDVILLTTHLFRKGFSSGAGGAAGTGSGGASQALTSAEGFQYEIGAAVSCLANIVTPDLAQDLLADVYGLINSSRPYVRKKAVLVLLRMFHAWPKALRLSFDRLKEKLDDENQGVVSAAVYVICELAAKNPKNYLALAPQFFKILTTSSNNWVLIKVVKLLGSLVPLEPRLAKKLTEPLTDIITTTPAKSLLYEAVNTLLSGELRSKTVVKLCLEKLRNFIEDPDQNLKYLGLLGLHKLLQKQPRVVAEHKDLILACLSDEDVTIRMRALDLITSMVSLKNLAPIVGKLLAHLAVAELGAASYREHVLSRILFICAQDGFAYVQDFEWYISILVDLTRLHGVSRDNALQINAQLLDVVVRVPGVRSYTIKQMANILLTKRLLPPASGALADETDDASTPLGTVVLGGGSVGHMSEVLGAVGFIIGEYPEYLEAQDDASYERLMSHLTSPRILAAPQAVQNVFVHAQAKLLSAALLQPFDNASVKDNLSTAQSKAPRKAAPGEEINIMSGEGDEMPEEAAQQPAAPVEQEEDLGEEEEEDFDANGLRKRKHPSLKRSFASWHAWIGRLLNILHTNLPAFTRADSVEVQERAVAYLHFVKWLIAQGEWTGAITGWGGVGAAPNTAAAKPAADDKPAATPAPAAAAPSPASRELNLLGGLDPLSVGGADRSLSIFDSPAPAATAQPAAPVNSAADLFSSLSISTGNGTPTAAGAAAAGPPMHLKDRLRAFAIQLGLLYSERLNPVHPKAQKKVALPKGLNLEQEINPGAEKDLLAGESDDDELGDNADDPYSSKSGKPKGALYDDEFDSALGSNGFGARQPKFKSSARSGSSKSGGSFYGEEASTASPDPKRMSAAEKEDAARRAERRRLQHANDPFYIKDTGSASGAPSVDHIPVRRLDDADMPSLKVVEDDILGGSSSSSASKPKKTFKVLKDDAMPDADSDDEGRGKKHKKHGKDKDRKKRRDSKGSSGDDALDMDLSAPLGADEVIPRVKSYAETQAEKQRAADAAAAAAEKEKERKSHRRGSRSDRDKERERDRDGKKRDKEHKSDRKDKDSSASSTSAAKLASATANFLDLFDMSGAAPAAAAPSSSSSSSQRKSSSASSAAAAASPSSSSSSASSSDARLRSTTVFKDSCVKVKALSSLSGNSGLGVFVSVEVSLAADNSKKIAALPKVVLEIKGGKYVKAFAPADGGAQGRAAAKVSDKPSLTLTVRDVPAGGSRTERFHVEFASAMEKPLELSARLSYTTDRDGKGKEDESCDLSLPLSTFVQARKLSPLELASALSSASPAPSKLASASLTLKKLKVSDALRIVSPTINVALVEAANFAATYYGTLRPDGSPVAVLVKAKKGDDSSLTIEIKSTSTRVSEALMEEVKQVLK